MKIRYIVGALLLGVATGCGQSSSLTAPTSSCSFLLSPTTQAVSVRGGTFTTTMTTTAPCQWTAAADMPWIEITAGTSGTTTGTITYFVPANAGDIRRGAINAQVIGRPLVTLTIIQDGVTP
jgi:hypothetical protein